MLGVSISAIVGDNGILTQAQNAVLSQTLAIYKEDFEYKLVELSIAEESTSIYAINENVKNYIESLDDNDVGTIAIYDSSLVYLSTNTTAIEVASNLGYITMSDEDYNYMLELTLIESAILSIEENGSTRVGLQMGTSEYGQVTVAGINYGFGWYIIGSNEDTFADELSELGITDTNIMTHYPYIVKYTTGAVQSTVGKMMYAGTDREIWKYTFNYTGEEGGLIVANLLNGVTNDSTKTSTQYGNMVAIGNSSFYGDEYSYDEDGGLILNETTNIGYADVSQETNIANECSICITIKGDLTQDGYPTSSSTESGYGGTLIAMSTTSGKYTMSLSVYDNKLAFTNYFDINSNGSNWRSGFLSGIIGQYKKGICIADVSEYNEKYLNIIVTAQRNGEAKLYLNGKLILTFEAGVDEFDYEYITLGDLRPNRGLKFIGTIYNYALYGSVLSDSEIAQNWSYISTELGIDENGNKIN